jgi:predicted HAD superfamily Cof-like phosphohydrolase
MSECNCGEKFRTAEDYRDHLPCRPRRSVDSLSLVREFHERFGQAIAEEPTVDDQATNRLRIKLLAEELWELADALGVEFVYEIGRAGWSTRKTDAIDALVDLEYVLMGAWLSLGFHRYRDAAMRAVHAANMAKLGPDGKPILRSDGKIMKPQGWQPPNLARILSGTELLRGTDFEDEEPTNRREVG